MIIGISGTFGAGKDTAAAYILEKTGWAHFSTSDEIRYECDRRNLPKDRDTLRSIGNELRSTFGAGVLAERILDKIREQQIENAIVTAIRNPGEVSALRAAGHFFFLFIDAPIELRYQRIISRAREGESVLSFEQFAVQEAAEKHSTNPAVQQLQTMQSLADMTLLNDSSITAFYEKIEREVLSKSLYGKKD